jgi:hypothetical protein
MGEKKEKEVNFQIYCISTRETLPVKYAVYNEKDELLYVKDAVYYDLWEEGEFEIVS